VRSARRPIGKPTSDCTNPDIRSSSGFADHKTPTGDTAAPTRSVDLAAFFLSSIRGLLSLRFLGVINKTTPSAMDAKLWVGRSTDLARHSKRLSPAKRRRLKGVPRMFPGHYAELTPSRPAVVVAETGEIITFSELESQSRRLAQALAAAGLRQGDHVAILMTNRLEYFVAMWATWRSGLRLVPVNRFLTPSEAAYIVNDSGSRVLIVSDDLTELAESVALLAQGVAVFWMAGGSSSKFADLSEVLSTFPPERLPNERQGGFMCYTSGSTGQPKGVILPLPDHSINAGWPWVKEWFAAICPVDPESRMLVPAPMYHSGPLYWSLATLSLGGSVVIMQKFDATAALRTIEKYQVTDAYFVPTMFVRMLKLPPADRRAFNVSSLRSVVHMAEPCPPDIKRQMIDWWGPVISEVYGASEFLEGTWISSSEWLTRPGSVGRAKDCIVHILDDEGRELPAHSIGHIFFESPSGNSSAYFNDQGKTDDAHTRDGWLKSGDVGYVDDEGYLFLTDRTNFMIISGGVNIYPREAENILIGHELVLDAAVVGVPDPEMGERVVAAIVLRATQTPSPELAADLIAYCRRRLAHYKCPQQIIFEHELPRLGTGKIYKQVLRDRYKNAASTGVPNG
jgi:long-chain acyl-CoA synthetase